MGFFVLSFREGTIPYLFGGIKNPPSSQGGTPPKKMDECSSKIKKGPFQIGNLHHEPTIIDFQGTFVSFPGEYLYQKTEPGKNELTKWQKMGLQELGAMLKVDAGGGTNFTTEAAGVVGDVGFFLTNLWWFRKGIKR